MDQQNLTPLIGRIEECSPLAGITPRLRFSVTINNKNQAVLEILSLSARVFVQFLDDPRLFPSGVGFYVGEAVREGSSATVGPGDQNYLNLYLSLSFETLGEIEQARAGKDISFQINIVYTILERATGFEFKGRFLTAELADPKGSNQFLSYQVPKSTWNTAVTQLGYPEEIRGSKQTLAAAIKNVRQAEEEAIAASRATKEASTSVAVSTLADAFQQEAGNLRKTSQYWLYAVLAVASMTLGLMGFYIEESFRLKEFSSAQTLMRIATLAILFGGIGLCIRTYNAYQHLELLNRHRVNIGRTFDIFIRSQPSESAKDVLAAFTAERMISFGRSSFPGKEGADSQLSFLTELTKNLIERNKP